MRRRGPLEEDEPERPDYPPPGFDWQLIAALLAVAAAAALLAIALLAIAQAVNSP